MSRVVKEPPNRTHGSVGESTLFGIERADGLNWERDGIAMEMGSSRGSSAGGLPQTRRELP